MENNGPWVILNLEEDAQVDVYLERFMVTRAEKGVALFTCPLYLRVWILREREA